MAMGVTFNRLPEIARALGSAVREIIQETVLEIETDIKVDMAEPKHGAIYPRGKTGQHQASEPGESPAIDYAVLVNSVDTQMLADDLGVVYESAEYAPALEYGTTRMAARPHMTPAADRAKPRFVARMSDLERRLG
jgi:hypothetical protein